MKPVFWFAIAVAVAFWAVDKLAFDGEYSTTIWKQASAYGQDWQREAKRWWERHGY
jgi:hypothetical protein